jgi:hypothetical protein
MVVVTEHETGPRAAELIEHVCAAASPVAMRMHAAAVRMALMIARDDDIVTASGHPSHRGPTGLAIASRCTQSKVSGKRYRDLTLWSNLDTPRSREAVSTGGASLVRLEGQADHEPRRHIGARDAGRLAVIRIRQDALGADSRADDEPMLRSEHPVVIQ